ncbi:hypothetical protein SAMN05192588_0104 [Nonlabens sp. Hel1_33_55]|uniref:hypothetical protein n=1 Tax=Nonlabens sp. Hel1_33_55 TaxID=1336802 RepID=UPI000875DA93|nr:hypothetical protein [Nonlabens sp. Hel1_33_55]SCX88693.1 hypothetical protein SAMN05192588_0104 [Nonlabens sp. Hel1_33_55]
MIKISTLNFVTTLLLSTAAMAQNIGVNTNSPTANLDVNGTLRIRSLKKANGEFGATGNVVYIMGVDENGNVVPIEIGENIVLESNKLVVQLPETDTSVAELPNGGTLEDNYAPGSDGIINDLDLGIVILPGDRRTTWPIVRLPNGDNESKVDITGFKEAPDGTMVYLYPTSGDIQLKKGSDESQPNNRIAGENDHNIKKNDLMLLMYDGNIKKWVVVSKH